MAEQVEEVQNQVEETEKPKRQRRTKEEIEADKKAKEQAKKKKAKEKAKKEAEKEARKAEREAKKEAYEALIDESKKKFENEVALGKNKKTEPVEGITVKNVLDDVKFDVEIDCQRQADQWEVAKKSQFILSILTGKDLSEIIVHKRDNGTYKVIDGKQRITVLREFLHNDFTLKLGSKEEPHYLNGKKFSEETDEEGNKTFKGLEEAYQDIIKNCELRVEELIGYTDEEADEQFKLKNSGVAVNLSQILKLGINKDRAAKLQEFVNDEATKRFKISEASKKKDVVRDVIIKSILLINNPDITSFSTKNIYSDMNELEDTEFNEACEKLEKAFVVLRETDNSKRDWLTNTSIPFAMYALAGGADTNAVSAIIGDENGKFKAASKQGTAGKASIQDRREEMDTIIK